jgi:tetratricopeptide (TPR) repeat protein
LPINIYNYQDEVANSAKPDVRTYFAEGLKYYNSERFREAIKSFQQCLKIEIDHQKLGAINIYIGNCYYGLHKYPKALEYYEGGLREARKAKDKEGEAAALGSLANSYLIRPASSVEARGNNVRDAVRYYYEALEIYRKGKYPEKYAMTQNNLGTAYMGLPAATPEERSENVEKAVHCYNEALEIRRKDKYPEDYAMTQNNLGTAYMGLPAATPEERSKNVEKAVHCYNEALEIRRKDKYPQAYCFTAANIGLALASVTGMEVESCHWLKEAYALKEYLPDQGKRLEEIMRAVCRE